MTDKFKQYELEQQCKTDAEAALEKQIARAIEKKYYSSTKSGRHFIHESLVQFAKQIREDVDYHSDKQRNQQNESHMAEVVEYIIRDLADYEQQGEEFIQSPMVGENYVSMICLKAIVDCYTQKTKGSSKLISIAERIGETLALELQYKAIFADDIPEFVKRYGKKLLRDPMANPKNKKSNPMMGMLRLMKHNGIVYRKPICLAKNDYAKVGLFLLNSAVKQGIVETKNTYINKITAQKIVVFTEAFHQMMEEVEVTYQKYAYHSHPLLIPPKPWEEQDTPSSKNFTGGFHFREFRNSNPMCRGFGCGTVFRTKGVDLLNRLQETRYHIDNAVLNVALKLKKQAISVGSFHAMPPSVEPLQRMKCSEEELRERKRLKKEEHIAHENAVKKFMRARLSLELANEYACKNEFYYAWSADHRGRLYPISRILHVQSSDFERSLLRFKQGCELTTASSLKWVKRAVGAAYLGGSDSYEARELWVDDNTSLIHAIANDPIGMIPEWEVAKEPWSFLQLCLEYEAVVISKTKTQWHIPVGVDSTASGLQLLSAMRRDAVGMKFANLLKPEPGAPPLDAYKAVLELAREAASKAGDEHLIPFLQDRKVGKPALMLSIYGGTHMRINEAIRNYFWDNNIEIEKEDINAVTTNVINASKAAFPKAYEALDWLRKLSKIAFKKGADSLMWSTPTKDTIDINYKEHNVVRIKTELMGRINASLGPKDDKPDQHSMLKSFPPSFVHSYDAALCKEAFHNWHKPLALIHDCYRCLPSDMEESIDRIKDAFMAVCEGDALARLADDLGVTEQELKRLPQGDKTLLNNVQDSVYFFN